jgi:hypothetical protein
MRRLVLFAFTFLFLFSASAQKAKKEKSATAWKTGGMFSIMGGQSGTRNWAPTGSEKFTFAGTASLNLWATKKWGKNTWDNTADLGYGMVYTLSQKGRKIEDKIDLYSKYGHELKGVASVGVVTALRSQFTNGYDYTEAPKKRISGFFAPAYLTLSPGIQLHTKSSTFAVHVGPDVRWVIVTNAPYSLVYQGGIKPDGSQERTLADLYGVDPGRQVRVEAGLYVSALFKKEIMKNVMWKSRLDLNSDVIAEDPLSVDVYWTNTIGMTVNKWLKVNYSFDLYKDEDVKMFGAGKNQSKTQMKSLLGVGLGVTF